MTNDKPISSERNEMDASVRRARRGFVLPTVMFAVAVMSIVVVAAINTASDERRSSRATREATLAMYAAEGGLRKVYGSWPSAAVKALNPGDSLVLGWATLPNRASYRTVIHRVDKGGLQEYNVVVHGRRTGASGGVATIIGVVGGIPLLTYGVFAKTSVSMGPNGVVDSYDSEVAPYTIASADTNATIWANGNVELSNITVKGDISAVGTITPGNGTVIQGDVLPGADPAPEMDIIACPAGGYTPAASIPSGSGISYNQGTGVLKLGAGVVFTLTGTSYFFSSITMIGGASLVVTPPAGQRTEIVLSSHLDAVGGTVVNTAGAPTTLGFSSCGSPATPATWNLSGGANAAYSVYAPNHPVVLTGSGDLKGAVVGASFKQTGGGKMHYDEALARLASKKLIVQKGTWSMFPGS